MESDTVIVKYFFRGFLIGYVAAYIGIPCMLVFSLLYTVILYANSVNVDIVLWIRLSIARAMTMIGVNPGFLSSKRVATANSNSIEDLLSKKVADAIFE